VRLRALALMFVIAGTALAQDEGELPFIWNGKKGEAVLVVARGTVSLTRDTRTGKTAPVRSSFAYELDRETRLVVLDEPKPRVFDVEIRTTKLEIDVDRDQHSESWKAGRDDPSGARSVYLTGLVTPLEVIARARIDAGKGTSELTLVEREDKKGRRASDEKDDKAAAAALVKAFEPSPAKGRRVGDTWTAEERRREDGFDLVTKRECRLVRVEAFRGRRVARIDATLKHEVVAKPPASGPVPTVVESEGEATYLFDPGHGRVTRATTKEKLVLRYVTGDTEIREERHARSTIEEKESK
jgi:hypothetical protein